MDNSVRHLLGYVSGTDQRRYEQFIEVMEVMRGLQRFAELTSDIEYEPLTAEQRKILNDLYTYHQGVFQALARSLGFKEEAPPPPPPAERARP